MRCVEFKWRISGVFLFTQISQRVAEERGVPLGREVGYVVRFDDCTSSETRIKFMTDGILVREMMMDPLLKQYSVLMLDEGTATYESTLIHPCILRLQRHCHLSKDLNIYCS